MRVATNGAKEFSINPLRQYSPQTGSSCSCVENRVIERRGRPQDAAAVSEIDAEEMGSAGGLSHSEKSRPIVITCRDDQPGTLESWGERLRLPLHCIPASGQTLFYQVEGRGHQTNGKRRGR
jgi:hypothetical protein